MKVYKIQNVTTGLFAGAGDVNSWRKFGKQWSKIGHLKNHFRCVIPDYVPKEGAGPYEKRPATLNEKLARIDANEVVIEYELVEVRRVFAREFVREMLEQGDE